MPRTRSADIDTGPPVLLVNTGRSGRVYDAAGHSLGGGERITVAELDAIGSAAVARGYLHAITQPAVPDGAS